MILRVCTWNLRKPGPGQAGRRVQALRDLDCDIYLLQEVTPHVWAHITGGDFFSGRAYAYAELGIEQTGREPHGAAVLARQPLRLSAAFEIPGLLRRQRGLAAAVGDGRSTVRVASWHAPNAAGDGVAAKMAAYEAVTRWLASIERPVIIGLDGNSWNRRTDLFPPVATDRQHPFFTEHAFHGGDPPHGLDDAILQYLRDHPAEYARCLAERPDGPLAVSYIRGGRGNPIEDRFDYLFVSPDVRVRACRYDLVAGMAAGSDHAVVWAEVEIGASEGS